MAEVTLENVTKVYGEDVVAVRRHEPGHPRRRVRSLRRSFERVRQVHSATHDRRPRRHLRAAKLFIEDERSKRPLSPRDRDIAMVFQNYALYPHMNVRENMGFRPEAKEVQRRMR